MAANPRRTLPARLRQLRQAAALSQQALAEKTGVSTEFISRIERGATLPSLDTLMALCDALHCTPDDLLILPSQRSHRFEDLQRRLEQATAPAARQAIRVAEAILEYETRRRS